MLPVAAGNLSTRGFSHKSDEVTVHFVLVVADNQLSLSVLYPGPYFPK